MSTADVPEWPGFAGWFGVILGLLCLVEPPPVAGLIAALTVLLLGCLAYGVYCHLVATGTLDASFRSPE